MGKLPSKMNENLYPNGERRPLTPEEKAARQKRLRRKRKFRIAVVIAFFTLVLAVLLTPVIIFTAFRVKNIVVNGKTPYTAKEIISVSGTAVGNNLVTADAEQIAENIKENLPYVLDVTVTKKLPNTLTLNVTKATEDYAVYLEATQTYLLADSELNILKTAAQCPAGATLVRCDAPVSQKEGEALAFVKAEDKKEKDQGTDTVLTVLKRITDAAKADKLTKLTVIDLRNLSDIQLVYDGRILLNLGIVSDIPQKINLAAKVIEQENGINPSEQGTLNLTVAKKAFFKPDVFSYLMPGEVPPPEEKADDEAAENGEDEYGSDEYDGEENSDNEEDSDYTGNDTDESDSDVRSYEAEEGEVG